MPARLPGIATRTVTDVPTGGSRGSQGRCEPPAGRRVCGYLPKYASWIVTADVFPFLSVIVYRNEIDLRLAGFL